MMKYPKSEKTRTGFTLVEILITIAIIGVLAGIIFVALNRVRDKGDDAKRKADIQQLELALKVYRSVRGDYPTTTDSGSLSALSGLVPDYIGKLPDDPKGDGSYPTWDGSTQNTYFYWRADDMPSGDCSAPNGYMLWYHLADESGGNAPDCVHVDDHSFVATP
jgi:general secretion pathway protein G